MFSILALRKTLPPLSIKNIEDEIKWDLNQLGHNKLEICRCIADLNIRLKWDITSLCLIYSRKNKKWFNGEIIDKSINKYTKEKWLIIEYNTKNTKRIQRFNPNIKPIEFKHDYYNDENHNKMLKLISNKWCKTISFKQDSMEWLNYKLSVYYNSMDRRYYYDEHDEHDEMGKFSIWCKANGFTWNDVKEKLKHFPSDCILTDFDETFPVDRGEKRDEYICNVLKNPDLYIYKQEIKNSGWMFHCVGIRKPEKRGDGLQLFQNIDTTSIVTIQSGLMGTDDIAALKQSIKNAYNIANIHDIFIVYADKIVSYDNKLKLSDLGITNRSLLLLGIVKGTIDSNDQHDTGYYEMKIEKTKGFDVIMQESDVDVYTMPVCRHKMNKHSLYHYAMNTFKDANNVCLKCPEETKYDPPDEWACGHCTFLNKMDKTRCEMCENDKNVETPRNKICGTKWNYSLIKQILSTDKYSSIDNAKLELLLSRNKVQKHCNVQKCPTCSTLYFKDDSNKTKLDNIKTMHDIEQHFRTECVLCERTEETVISRGKYNVGSECEIYTKLESTRRWVKGTIIKKFDNRIEVKYHGDLTKTMEINEDKEYIRSNDCVAYTIYGNSFCWFCGKEWEYNHICDSKFKIDLVNILKNAETKQIGSVRDVASIRCCPNCSQLITHSDACKHIRCISCKIDFCFVCLKPKTNNGWQCGSSSDRCPIADRQNNETLPDSVVINKKSFQLYSII